MPVAKAAAAPDTLAPYRKKRDFAVTPEPRGGGEPGMHARQYVIQKHWASHLHYDLRLELDGTMKSWAVPRGPSMDPADKRMAVQVEDHPISYNRFEGQIPPGQYGSGRVIIWDKGHWLPEGDARQGYRDGKLKFELQGHKLQGRWTLVRMHGRGDEKQPPWLLIKEHDGFARPASEFSVVEQMPDSVASLPSLPAGGEPAPAGNGRATPRPARRAGKGKGEGEGEGEGEGAPAARAEAPRSASPKATLPAALAPQLALLVDAPPAQAEDWLWEMKFDGYRMLARLEARGVRLITRNGHDWTDRMPELAQALQGLPLRSGWLDGEVVAVNAQGVPDFQELQNAFSGESRAALIYYLFDMPYAEGRDLRRLPVEQRRERLRELLTRAPTPSLRFSETLDARPEDLLASACQLGLEGLIGKRREAPYASRRNGDWIKLKCQLRQEFVIGGYTAPQGARSGFGALLLGVHEEDGSLRYAGSVGTGFDERALQDILARLRALASAACPFADPAAVPRRAHWVAPRLLCEVSFAAWTVQKRVRQAVFHGLRDDKPARAIVRETPVHLDREGEPVPHAASKVPTKASSKASMPSASESTSKSRSRSPAGAAPPVQAGPMARVSNPERVIDAQSGVRKIDLARYYQKVAPLMMEHLQARPVALVRAPDGVEGEQFFQKHLDARRMDGIEALDVALDDTHEAMIEVARPEGLLSGAQMNVIEYHTWNARHDLILRPDRMTFDLDPGEGVPWSQVQEAAHLVHVLLGELGLKAFLKTSGGKGLHVVVPVKRLYGWDAVKGFSQAVVQHLAQTIPQRFVARSGPRNRVGKIFVDYLRNGWGATTACAWSARARPGMGISVPVAWSELEGLSGGAHWQVGSVDERLRQGNAPWAAYARSAVALAHAAKTLGYAFKPGQR